MTFAKERLEKDALNRIRWDKKLNPDDYSIVYLDRVANRLAEAKYSEIGHHGDYITVGGAQIPVHRIREIRRKGETVWAERRG